MKKLFLVMPAVLLAVFMATSCRHAKGSTSGQEINEIQLAAYNDFISNLRGQHGREVSADEVKECVEEFNSIARASLLGIVIKDTQAGQPIAKGTSEKDLRKRFHVKKV